MFDNVKSHLLWITTYKKLYISSHKALVFCLREVLLDPYHRKDQDLGSNILNQFDNNDSSYRCSDSSNS